MQLTKFIKLIQIITIYAVVMPYCAVKLCGKSSNNSSYMKGGISFHRFPQCPNIKKIWIDATKQDDNWFPTTHSVICSRHFTEDCYKPLKKRILFENAIPTLYLPVVMAVQDHDESSPMLQELASEITSANLSRRKKSISNTELDSAQGKDLLESNLKQLDSSSNTPPKSPIDPLESTLQTQTKSTFSAMERKRLIRTICTLQDKLKIKNIKMKRLRAANRRLKIKINSLQTLLNEDDAETEDMVEKIIVYS